MTQSNTGTWLHVVVFVLVIAGIIAGYAASVVLGMVLESVFWIVLFAKHDRGDRKK